MIIFLPIYFECVPMYYKQMYYKQFQMLWGKLKQIIFYSNAVSKYATTFFKRAQGKNMSFLPMHF